RNKHLDELPQLFLVLTCKMSQVGPRPEMPNLHAAGDKEFAELRTTVRPGCAGLWQVSEHQDRMIWEAPIYDMAYIKHPSLGFDLWILMRTMLFMLHLKPAVAFADVPARFLPPVRFVLHEADPVLELVGDEPTRTGRVVPISA
ncbi:MAG: sugar transferase, partial [Acidimicrobiales bacterium]|nr:sugar transferase [Acidimicrobiales bacterium]